MLQPWYSPRYYHQYSIVDRADDLSPVYKDIAMSYKDIRLVLIYNKSTFLSVLNYLSFIYCCYYFHLLLYGIIRRRTPFQFGSK